MFHPEPIYRQDWKIQRIIHNVRTFCVFESLLNVLENTKCILRSVYSFSREKFSSVPKTYLSQVHISKTEFRQILNSFFQRYFNILMLYLLCPSTWLDVVIKSLCKSVLYLNAFETSKKIYFMCILNKSFGEKYSGQN